MEPEHGLLTGPERWAPPRLGPEVPGGAAGGHQGRECCWGPSTHLLPSQLWDRPRALLLPWEQAAVPDWHGLPLSEPLSCILKTGVPSWGGAQEFLVLTSHPRGRGVWSPLAPSLPSPAPTVWGGAPTEAGSGGFPCDGFQGPAISWEWHLPGGLIWLSVAPGSSSKAQGRPAKQPRGLPGPPPQPELNLHPASPSPVSGSRGLNFRHGCLGPAFSWRLPVPAAPPPTGTR